MGRSGRRWVTHEAAHHPADRRYMTQKVAMDLLANPETSCSLAEAVFQD
ncbi:MAG: hypothetical protein PVH30_04335 [Desulfobacterales bacterium]|jgi:hypothetical protein